MQAKKLVTAAKKLMPISVQSVFNFQCHKKDAGEDWVKCTCGSCVSESCVDYDSVADDASGTALQMVARVLEGSYLERSLIHMFQ